MIKEGERPKVKDLTEEELKALYGRIDDKQTKEDAELIKNSIKFTFWIQKKNQRNWHYTLQIKKFNIWIKK